MNKIDQTYINLIQDILANGSTIQSRNSETKRLTTKVITFETTPLISVRRTAWKNALREMEWFLSGSNNVNDLHESVRHWWSPWANKWGNIHNNYSIQFREFCGQKTEVDQIDYLLDEIKQNPQSRRQVISTWNTADMSHEITPITNCHGTVIQTHVNPDNTVDMTMYQRSADIMLGVPHNWLQYWAFLMYLAHQSGRLVGKFTWIGGDCHIYKAHYDAAQEVVNTDISPIVPPQLTYTQTSGIFKADDFSLTREYKPLIKKSLELIV